MARRALTDPDEDSRATWKNDAPIAQERWQCSAARDGRGRSVYEPHDGLSSLDSECRGVVEEIAALTGTEPCADCPMARTRSENNAWIHVVTKAYRSNEKGALLARYPNPDAVLIDALDVLTDAVEARSAHEDEERAKRMAAAPKHPFPPPESLDHE